jgi:nucleotide-binding universal stress UspA family protein
MASTRSGLKRIVVGVDGSKQAEAALKWTVRLAKSIGAQITAVYAIDVPVYFAEPYAIPVTFDEKWRAEMKNEFERRWCKPLIDSGVRYRTVIEDGRPATVISAVADREHAGLIVSGRRGRGGVAEVLLGSVSHELVLNAKHPVLLIPPDTRRRR